MSATGQAMTNAPEASRAYQQQLCAAGGFTLDDLQENRAGRISAQQGKVQSKDSRSRVGNIVGGVLIVALGLGAVYFSFDKGGPIMLIGGLGLAIFGVYQIVTKSKKHDNPVASFEGAVRKKSVLRQGGGGGGIVGALASAAVASALNMKDYYYACDGGPDVKVSREAHDALQDGQRHRVYYTPSGLLLLSIEPL